MIRGYHRRRGWQAWHTAWLQRGEFKPAFPTLASIMGEQPREPQSSAGEIGNSLRLWGAVIAGGR